MAYKAPEVPTADVIQSLGFDQMQEIKFNPDYALWKDGKGPFPVQMFHPHKFAPHPVKIHIVENGMAHEVHYRHEMFDYGDTGVGEKLPNDLGFAGFRVLNGAHDKRDWLAFQGASYFRSSGAEEQYGASARGIALNTATETKEEFPSFREFWLSEPKNGDMEITIYAFLDGPSITGAYEIRADRSNGATMDIHAELFLRANTTRLGLAPLTSMYWFGENDGSRGADWRPEIHDNDGLAMWTGSGERIFRPLANPPTLQVNAYLDENPRGFGLVQRDRDFDHYQDDGAFYERRPSIWIEPKGQWGKGAVKLVEIPTNDEIHDNIVAFWEPEKPAQQGDQLSIDYRLHWRNRQPYPPENVAQVIATRTGNAGVPGQERPDPKLSRKFVVDFQGGPLSEMEARYDITPEVTTPDGDVSNAYVIKVVGTDYWRAAFDITTDKPRPLNIRCFLKLGDQTLSETWIYQYFPKDISQGAG